MFHPISDISCCSMIIPDFGSIRTCFLEDAIRVCKHNFISHGVVPALSLNSCGPLVTCMMCLSMVPGPG